MHCVYEKYMRVYCDSPPCELRIFHYRMTMYQSICIANMRTNTYTYTYTHTHQVFGELAVLDCETPSPVSAISSTAVEVFCFDINAMAHVQW